MADRSLALARARAQWRLIAALAATVVVLVFALSFALGWLTDATRAAVMASVDEAAPADRQTVLSVPLSGDPAEQAAGVDALLAARLGDSLDVQEQAATSGGTARWTLTADPARFDPWRIAWIAADLGDLGVLVQDAGLAPGGASTEGGLAGTLDGLVGDVLAVAVVAPVPLAMTAIGGIIAVLQLARLLGRARAGETETLRARGLDARTARRSARGEALAVVATGAAIGWLAAAAAVMLTGGAFTVALLATWPVPVLAVVVLVFVSASGQLGAADAAAADRAGRARGAVSGLGAGLVVLAAAVFVWQLSGLEGDAAELTADPWSLVVVALAPALGLAAVATVALLVFGPAAAAVARLGARGRGLVPALPARTVARNLAVFGVVVALLALAAGGAAFGGTMLTTWQRAAEQAAALTTGADVRATVTAGAVSAAAVASTAAAPEVTTAAAAVTDAATAGGEELQLVALPAASIGELVTPLPAAGLDPQQLADHLAVAEPVGASLGAGASGIRMTFAVTAGGGSRPTIPSTDVLSAEAWFVDALGTPVRAQLELTMAPDDSTRTTVPMYASCDDPTYCPFEDHWSAGTLTATADLAPPGDWTLVGVTIGFPNTPGGQRPTFTPGDLATPEGTPLTWPSTAPFTIDAAHPAQTLTWAPAPDAVPVVVTPALADTLGLGVGEGFELTLDRSRRVIPVTISDIVRVIPGTAAGSAALVPLEQATLAMLAGDGTAVAPTELWASGPGAATAARTALPTAAVAEASRHGAFGSAAVIPWWIAIVATALLGGVALVAAAVGLAQQRATEVFVLRALGLAGRRQSRLRTGELAAVAVAAFVVGGALGYVLAVLCGPVLTRTAVAGVPPIIADEVVIGLIPLAVGAALAAAALAVASLAVGRIVAGQALAGRVREAA